MEGEASKAAATVRSKRRMPPNASSASIAAVASVGAMLTCIISLGYVSYKTKRENEALRRELANQETGVQLRLMGYRDDDDKRTVTAAAAAAAVSNGRSSDKKGLHQAAATATGASTVQPPSESTPNVVSTSKPQQHQPTVIYPVGIIRSPYPQRAGTPRQGLLAPHSRSRLVLHSSNDSDGGSIPFDTVDGLDQYSHVWIVFQFHLNPVGKGGGGGNVGKARQQSRCHNTSTSSRGGDGDGDEGAGEAAGDGKKDGEACKECGLSLKRPSYPSKIRPPRARGTKVGCLASRSPHRPNDIGLSLARLESVTTESYVDCRSATTNGKKKRRKRVVITLLGLDLCDGTPVFDIKPYVPWDSVTLIKDDLTLDGKCIDTATSSATANGKDQGRIGAGRIRVPFWVAHDDALSVVKWSNAAKEAVLKAREDGELYPLYPPTSKKMRKKSSKRSSAVGDDNRSSTMFGSCGEGNSGLNGNDGASSSTKAEEEVVQAISEIVAQDPRAIHEGRGQSTTITNMAYEITFGTLRVGFHVVSSRSGGNSMDDHDRKTSFAEIISVARDEGDASASAGSYQHSLYLRRQAEKGAKERGKKIKWACPVREGITEEDLYLQD